MIQEVSSDDVDTARRVLVDDGVVLVRGLMDDDEVSAVLADIEKLAREANVLDGTRSIRDAEIDDEALLSLREISFKSARFHQLSHSDQLVGLTSALLGAETLVQPRKFLRIATPRGREFATPPHQDHRYVQGTVDVLTTWIPLHEVTAEGSPMRFVPGSHRAGLLEVSQSTGDALPDTVGAEHQWVAAPCGPGDALMFHSLMVHSTLTPSDSRNRFSVDFRYQRRDAPMASSALLAPYVCSEDMDGDPARWSFDAALDLGGVEFLPSVPSASLGRPVTESEFLRHA